MVCIAFTGGGTGGHIYPGLAVACRLKRRLDCRIFWIGSRAKLDKTIVEAAGLDFFSIPAGKLRRNFSLKNVSDFFKVAAGFFAARKILKRERPVMLFSKGGFVSVPPCAAAASLGITVFTHESDYSPGLATRINAGFALRSGGKIITAYGETAERFPRKIQGEVLVLPNPVREEFRNADPRAGRAFLNLENDRRILLVLGGSQGSGEINRLVRESLEDLTKWYTVVHQTGAGSTWPGEKPQGRYRPFSYIQGELPHVLAAAELVLCRSGAGTIWECAVAGKPMVLLPLAGSGTRGDQIENARFFERAGAAVILPPDRRRPEDLIRAIRDLAEDQEKQRAMAKASARIGADDGAGRIAEVLRGALPGTDPEGELP
ncbi:MAG: undecaprenyldiphospho-muramoylpentapeptide beta-N-acetylglucosaminyltransferase [Spirochaetaceae bacterium]|jgi:UDP-N-acetylglucosamine--N-acetylmuramyl-(pentapeptide) pyrophosphoryl-undecaprenol N-acetylglucosamine transferase|nr:undecaprenyldiphospho-muramoylpentapeptide beta-N-acetylglucosaminyltransferase [Spirochaetaceae bacterium]